MAGADSGFPGETGSCVRNMGSASGIATFTRTRSSEGNV